ncbi:hypothetical protein [Micromonospora mirobrigensis]|uniref:Uncharacterized protein n=1 Tax=Micromonospora mirobrigensis TaxID=262898 RepID=A0A1C4ZQN1_9ACTN|nr:hypothetical protein [Micromonospora mirobrigensis]SCF35288.1 hypothetical protein GA0070564_106183 [Micromonospora mirobrigensis]
MGMRDAEGHGPPDGLPDLPPEWGRVVVPDDASALAAEAAQLRRELRRQAAVRRRRRLLGLRPGPDGRLPLRLSLLVLLVAVLTTVAGLAAVTWPRSPRGGARPTVLPQATAGDLVGRPLPALDLVGPDQRPVPLRGLLPAVILLVDGCACAERVTEAAVAAPAGVTVVTVVGKHAAGPTPTAPGPPVLALADPAGGLRAFLRLPVPTGRATALLVDRYGTLTEVVPQVGTVEDYRVELDRLAG